MKARDIVLAVIILAAIAGIVISQRRESKLPKSTVSPQIEEKLEEIFKFEIPEDIEKIELEDVFGLDGFGVATREYTENKFTHTVLVDLPDPAGKTFYEGWLIRGNEGDAGFKRISTGRLQMAKGGFLLEFESSSDYSDFNRVLVTLETVADSTPEIYILEGSF